LGIYLNKLINLSFIFKTFLLKEVYLSLLLGMNLMEFFSYPSSFTNKWAGYPAKLRMKTGMNEGSCRLQLLQSGAVYFPFK
jgi:uncharacterized RDD family membrane protein YckC